MYKGFYEDRFKGMIHIWDDKYGHHKVRRSEFIYGYKNDPEGDLKNMTGDPVKMIKREGKSWNRNNTYEIDIPMETRVLIDLYGDSDEVSKDHVDFYFDIETEVLDGFPDFNNPINKITSIAYYERYVNSTFDDEGRYYVLILDKDNQVQSSKEGNREIISFDNEHDLLVDFVDRVRELHPTVITGWNIENFDFPYLFRRSLHVIGYEKFCKISPINTIEIREINTDTSLRKQLDEAIMNLRNAKNGGAEGWEIEELEDEKKRAERSLRRVSSIHFDPSGNPRFNRDYNDGDISYEKMYLKIAGISILDYLPLYKNFTFSQKPSYRLDAIGREEVNLGKIEYEGSLNKLFKEDINKFIEYNLNDVEIVKRIEDKLKFIDLTKGICHKGHVSYSSVFYPSAFIEGAILTYTKKIDLVTKNRVPKDPTMFGGGNFIGAYVKTPIPGKYKWIYDLDLTSLYPSIIMSLNISPETKVGKVTNWEMEDYVGNDINRQYNLRYENGQSEQIEAKDLYSLIREKNYSIAGNGTLYSMNKKGLIPDILEKWFEERVELKREMGKYGKLMNQSGPDKKEEYKKLFESFKRKQHIQKILLNSVYGVLGLSGFRFFDLDNAAAVTVTGQQLIKNTSEFVNVLYNKKLNTQGEDYCIYIDTDSNFFSSEPWIRYEYPENEHTDEFMTEKTFEVASIVQNSINKFYSLYSKRFHNIDTHRFEIKQEMIAKSGVWFAKKRYAQLIINEDGLPVERMDVKGLDVVRSDFPPIFREFMSKVLKDILEDKDNEYITGEIISFKNQLKEYELKLIAKPTGCNGLKKYLVKVGKNNRISEYAKGTPVHVKAVIFYNDFLRLNKLDKKYELMKDNEKIKWIYLKDNRYKFPIIAFKGYDDPPDLLEFIRDYSDYEKIFNRELKGKIQDFYDALGWGIIPENNLIFEFFEF